MRAYKSLRIAALVDHPLAFTTTLSEVLARPAAEWYDQMRDHIEGIDHIAVVQSDVGSRTELVGIGTGRRIDHRRMYIGSVWIRADWRGRGLATQLVRRLCLWGAQSGLSEAMVSTTLSNPGPLELYRQLGFLPSSEVPYQGCCPPLALNMNIKRH